MRKLRKILIGLFLITSLVSCAAPVQHHTVVPKPILKPYKAPGGGVCFTKDDATKLYQYIIQLENNCQ